MVYNAGSGSWGNIEKIKPEEFESNWRINAFGLMLVSQEVIPAMKKKGRGNIIIIGATASRRGGINTAAFAPAKAAQRSLAESMAKYLGPSGIHVALIIIDMESLIYLRPVKECQINQIVFLLSQRCC